MRMLSMTGVKVFIFDPLLHAYGECGRASTSGSGQGSYICILKYTGVRAKAHLQNTLFSSHEQHRKWSAFLAQSHYATHTVRIFCAIRSCTNIARSEDVLSPQSQYTSTSNPGTFFSRFHDQRNPLHSIEDKYLSLSAGCYPQGTWERDASEWKPYAG